MIQSSFFSFDESSVWDPKIIREHLCIPEDQLNILSNIPGWAKDRENANTFGIEKDTTIENSQSSQYQNLVTTQNNEKIQNIELFDKYLQLQGNTINTYKEYRKKLARSVSLFDIDKISDNLSTNRSIKRTLSTPILYWPFDNSCTESLNKELPVHKPIEFSIILDKKESESNSNNSLKVMEVESQLPVNISSRVEKVDDYESRVIVIENIDTLSVVHTAENANNFSIQPTAIANVNISADNFRSNLNEKENKSHDLESCENQSISCIVKQTDSENANTSIDTGDGEMKLNAEKITTVSEVSAENIESLKLVPKEQPSSTENMIDSKQSSNIQDARAEVVNDLKASHQETDDKKSEIQDKIAEKRKLECQVKMNKKRKKSNKERQGHFDARSIKRAGEVYYTDDDVRSMMNIMKCFL